MLDHERLASIAHELIKAIFGSKFIANKDSVWCLKMKLEIEHSYKHQVNYFICDYTTNVSKIVNLKTIRVYFLVNKASCKETLK